MQGGGAQYWWERRATFWALILLSVVPLLWPKVPPLTDLLGHMGRYAVQLDHDPASPLRAWYRFDWALIGNLGVDLLIIPMSKVFGLELGVKLIVMTIPALTVSGFLLISREVHGRISPSVLFALPLAYSLPFHFGFVNFALSMALALNAFALWMRLGREGRFRLRALVFVPISLLLWVTHVYGWGLIGILALSDEIVRNRRLKRGLIFTLTQTGLRLLALLPPFILMVVWRGGDAAGTTGDWFQFSKKLIWLILALKDRWQSFDSSSALFIVSVFVWGLFDPQFKLSARSFIATVLLLLAFIVIPRVLLGSNYADMRLMPFLMAIAVMSTRPSARMNPVFLKIFASIGLVFFLTRTAATTASLYLYAERHESALAALDHVPIGARLVAFVKRPCGIMITVDRTDHVPALAIVRRQAFSNDQWTMAGAQLLRVTKADAPGFVVDPSQFVSSSPCAAKRWTTFDRAITALPRGSFDFVWVIGKPAFAADSLSGFQRIWTNGTDSLYKIERGGIQRSVKNNAR